MSENRQLARIAKCTVISDNALQRPRTRARPGASLAVEGHPNAVRIARLDSARVGACPHRSRDDQRRLPGFPAVSLEFEENRMTAYFGWAATAVFIASYFFTRPVVLRAVQMAGALMWVTYGALDRRACRSWSRTYWCSLPRDGRLFATAQEGRLWRRERKCSWLSGASPLANRAAPSAAACVDTARAASARTL